MRDTSFQAGLICTTLGWLNGVPPRQFQYSPEFICFPNGESTEVIPILGVGNISSRRTNQRLMYNMNQTAYICLETPERIVDTELPSRRCDMGCHKRLRDGFVCMNDCKRAIYQKGAHTCFQHSSSSRDSLTPQVHPGVSGGFLKHLTLLLCIVVLLLGVAVSLLQGCSSNSRGDGPLLVAGHLGSKPVLVMIDTGSDYDWRDPNQTDDTMLPHEYYFH